MLNVAIFLYLQKIVQPSKAACIHSDIIIFTQPRKDYDQILFKIYICMMLYQTSDMEKSLFQVVLVKFYWMIFKIQMQFHCGNFLFEWNVTFHLFSERKIIETLSHYINGSVMSHKLTPSSSLGIFPFITIIIQTYTI